MFAHEEIAEGIGGHGRRLIFNWAHPKRAQKGPKERDIVGSTIALQDRQANEIGGSICREAMGTGVESGDDEETFVESRVYSPDHCSYNGDPNFVCQ